MLLLAAAVVLRLPAPLAPRDLGDLALGYLPILLFAALALALAGRLFFAGMTCFIAAGGVAFADWLKRRELREPLVFADIAELREVFVHSDFYLPFVPKALRLAVVAGVGLLAVLSIWVEPPLPAWPLPSIVAALALVVAIALLRHAPGFPGWLRQRGFSGDAQRDMAVHGLAATLTAYPVLARDERESRRRAAFAETWSQEQAPLAVDSIVLVQNESFFDLRRIDPALLPDGLPAFDRACASALQHGRLAVPAWGANTVRSEFAVLSGIGEDGVGLDRFNPYFLFARRPVPSVAWRLRAAGFRTVCLHPFDRAFYGRRAVLPNLGFETFIGQEALCIDGPMDDVALADRILAMLGEDDRPLFVFAITMGNHGPWPGGPGEGPGSAFDAYRAGLRRADDMIARLCTGLETMKRRSLLAFYGDHQPNMPAIYDRPGFADSQTDYFIWSPGRSTDSRLDIAAEDLAQLIVTNATRPVAWVELPRHLGSL